MGVWTVKGTGQEGQARDDRRRRNQEWLCAGPMSRKCQVRGHETMLHETPQMPKLSARPEAFLLTTPPQLIL